MPDHRPAPPASMPPWQREGFAAQPALRFATDADELWRVTGGSSRNVFGNCFFEPASPKVDVTALSAVEMEYNLNAALWGNAFRFLHWYSVVVGTGLWVGPAAQSGFMGRDPAQATYDHDPKIPKRDDLVQVVLVDADRRSGVVRRVLTPDEVKARVIHEGEQPIRGSSYIGRTGDDHVPRPGGFGPRLPRYGTA